LIVSGTATRAFELGHPALVQGYAIDIGGDILGGAVNASGGSASSSIKGGVSTTIKNDATAFDFWESMEKSLTTIIGKRAPAVTRIASSTSNQAISGKGTPTQTNSQVATTVEKSGEQAGGDGEGSGNEQRVTVNRLTGTIVVTASKRNLENVENYLNMVRRVLNRQVLVEARIIEVQLSDSLNFGVDWSFLDNFKELGGTFAAGFGELNLASRSFNDVVESSVPKFRIGTSRTNFQTLLTALQTQGDVSTLSNPRVNVMNGQTALLSVGRNISFISKVTSTTTVASGSAPITTFNVETGSVLSGVLVGMVPFINEHGEISITITPIISDLVTMNEKSIGKAGEQTVISLPTVDLKEMSTTVKVRDNQLVVIGGLISKKELVEDEKVPLLGDIPGLGYLFTRKKTQNSKSELVVILQPKLVSNDTM
jgi:MSHA type pilus biogenesis protein MshL